MKKIISIIVIFCCMFSACSSSGIKDNQIIMAPDIEVSDIAAAKGDKTVEIAAEPTVQKHRL